MSVFELYVERKKQDRLLSHHESSSSSYFDERTRSIKTLDSKICELFLEELKRTVVAETSPKKDEIEAASTKATLSSSSYMSRSRNGYFESSEQQDEERDTSPTTVTSDDMKSPPNEEEEEEEEERRCFSPQQPSSTWKCQRCTFINENSCTMCVICQCRRPRTCAVATIEKKTVKKKTVEKKTIEKDILTKKKRRNKKTETDMLPPSPPPPPPPTNISRSAYLTFDYKEKLVQCFRTHFKNGKEATAHEIVDKLVNSYPLIAAKDKRSRYVSICKALNRNSNIFQKNVRAKNSTSGMKFAFFRFVGDSKEMTLSSSSSSCDHVDGKASSRKRKLFTKTVDTSESDNTDTRPLPLVSPPRLMSPNMFKDGPCICGRLLSVCIRPDKEKHVPRLDTIKMYVSRLQDKNINNFKLPKSYDKETKRIRLDEKFVGNQSLSSSRCLPCHLAQKRREKENQDWNQDRFVLGQVAERACTLSLLAHRPDLRPQGEGSMGIGGGSCLDSPARHTASRRDERRNARAYRGGYSQITKERPSKRLRFGRSKIHAWGVFAGEPISAGDLLIEYKGELIRHQVADLREEEYERNQEDDYMFRIDDNWVCDATRTGSLARFINHSCDPNCRTQIVNDNGKKKIFIYAKRNIRVDEELAYDYKFPIEEDKIPCHCGASACRGTLN